MHHSSRKKTKKYQAFSLIELAIVLLIIGLIISGILGDKALISKARISAARALTESSPINSISGLSLWLESSMESSFAVKESDDGKTISTWIDNNAIANSRNSATQSTEDNKPTYSNTINHIHAVRFDGTDSFFNIDGSFLNNSDYTIFVTEKKLSNKSDNYFFGDSEVTTENENLLLGYSTDSTVIHSQLGSNSYSSAVDGLANTGERPRFFTFIQNSISGKKTYVNGMLTAESSDPTLLSNISTVPIGKEYNGEIGEIVAFNFALSNAQRLDVESYLSKKWSIQHHPNTDCSAGVVSNSGCNVFSCTVSETGVSSSTVVNASGTLTCNGTGYTGTVSYTCAGEGVAAAITGSCSCATGYILDGGVCVVDACPVSLTGVSATTVSSGSGSLTCDDLGYDGSISYSCSGGTLTPTGSCDCAEHYSLSGGTCEADCSDPNFDATALSNLPSGVSGLQLWLDANESYVTKDGSNNVSSWTDRSGNSRNATQSTTSSKPIWREEGLNGFPSIDFDGSNDKLTVGGSNLAFSNITIFAVASNDDSMGNQSIIGRAGNYSNNKDFLIFLSSGEIKPVYFSGNSGYLHTSSLGTLSTTPKVIMSSWDQSTQESSFSLNGINSFTGPIYWSGEGSKGTLVTKSTPDSPAAEIGNRPQNSMYYNGDMSEILIYNKILSTSERENVENYLKNKWCIF